MTRKVYSDPIQEGVRRIVGRSLVRTFALFNYEKHKLVDVYCPTFGVPHEAKIREVIDIVEYEMNQHQQSMNGIIQNMLRQGKDDEAAWFGNMKRILVENFSRIGAAFVARQIMDTTHSFRVNKNWNSHGATLGASVCQLAALLSSLDNANSGACIQREFPVLIPQGNIQTGHKYGHHDMCYVEYMTAAIEPLVITGGVQNYLNHGTFVRDKHAEKV